MRIQAALIARDHYKVFRAKICKLELKQLVFRFVLSILISALVKLNVSKRGLDRLKANMMALARRSLACKAVIKNVGAAHIIKKPKNDAMKFTQLGSFEVELGYTGWASSRHNI